MWNRLRCNHTNKASRCLVRHWGTKSVVAHLARTITEHELRRIQCISRVLGCSCCIAWQRRTHLTRVLPPQHTIRVCGVAWLQSVCVLNPSSQKMSV